VPGDGGVDVDQEAYQRLRDAGIIISDNDELPIIAVALDDNQSPVVVQDEIPVIGSVGKPLLVKLKPIADLFTGSRVPPSFSDGPTPEYETFFELIEFAAANYCVSTGRIERDAEFESVYAHLRRRPDGKHSNPVFSYLRAAVRLYMSVRDVSRLEFEAVVDRLRRSAKHFALDATTANYYHLIKDHFELDDGKAVPWPMNQMLL
jgi:hypothetical protein